MQFFSHLRCYARFYPVPYALYLYAYPYVVTCRLLYGSLDRIGVGLLAHGLGESVIRNNNLSNACRKNKLLGIVNRSIGFR